MTPQECFDTLLPAALAANPETAARLDTVLRVRFTGDGGGDWTVVLKDPPAVRPFTEEDRDLVQAVMTMAVENFALWLTSGRIGVQMVLDKRLVVTGPAGHEATKLRHAITLIPSS